MQRLLIATTNQHKLAEYRALLGDLPFELVGLSDVGIADDVEETGTTFEANAQLKAEAYGAQSGLITLADDSGLEIAALNGAPGVYSARYGGVTGAAQLELVLTQMDGLPFHERMARFVCVIAVAAPGQPVRTVEGTVPGAIELAPKGTHGFGYDPIFYVLDRGVTLAELPAAEKNRISHRAVAVRKLHPLLGELAAS